jgi:hypothetical protein
MPEKIIRKMNLDQVMNKTITGDRKIDGKKISLIEFFRIQSQNPSLGFILSIFILLILVIMIPVYPRISDAVQVNEEKKAAFEAKLMPRSLAIPVNMLPYLRFQYQALVNGKYDTWHNQVFQTGSCDINNLAAMPKGMYKRAIATGCFQFDEIQNQYSSLCMEDNCIIDPNIITRIDYIMNQIESPFWDKGFVEEPTVCSNEDMYSKDVACN